MSLREQQVALLKVIEYLAAVVFVVGALVWGWYLTLLFWLILVVLPYSLLRVIQNGEHENELPGRLCQHLPEQKARSQEQTF
ncbi:hypothetical protein [Nitrospira sp. BLG_1]|uniref:hypothetical protein n=1 Tax=Nitrospira sp. BLG_1 TaxID=3395883 RepID=UPI0039BD3C19